MNKNSMNILAGIVVMASLVACKPADKSQDSATTVSGSEATETAPINSGQQVSTVPGLASAYADDVFALPVGGNCALDAVDGKQVTNGKFEQKRSVPATFGGWVADSSGAVPTDPVLVVHNDAARYAVTLAAGVSRTDVAEVMKNPALAMSGFESPVVLSDVPAGTYDLSVVMPGSTPHRCPLNVLVTLTE